MFIITERQYNIIMQQAQSCYPQESGGILGGHDNRIQAVLPIANKNLYDRTQEFALWKEDIERGYVFLEKYNMQYLGIYHTHPKGVPYPSEQDLSHGQKYLFIVGLRDRYNPELRAWRCEGKKVYQEDIKIVSDAGVTVIDVTTGKPKLSQNTTKDEMGRLANMINAMIAGKDPQYIKLEAGRWDASSFSTFA